MEMLSRLGPRNCGQSPPSAGSAARQTDTAKRRLNIESEPSNLLGPKLPDPRKLCWHLWNSCSSAKASERDRLPPREIRSSNMQMNSSLSEVPRQEMPVLLRQRLSRDFGKALIERNRSPIYGDCSDGRPAELPPPLVTWRMRAGRSSRILAREADEQGLRVDEGGSNGARKGKPGGRNKDLPFLGSADPRSLLKAMDWRMGIMTNRSRQARDIAGGAREKSLW